MSLYQLTVITPVFNGATFIERCLRNVLDQNCAAVEHLVMDGGSTDGTQEIVERLASTCPRIRLVSERDKGQADAMNKGIGLASAPVVSFLNVDDTYEPATLQRIVGLLPELSEPGFLVGNCNVHEQSGQTWVSRPSRLRIDDVLVGSLKMPHPINPSSYFYHRSLHDRVGLYDVTENYVMDLEFLLRALPAAHSRYVNETWGNFYMLAGTKTFDDLASGMGARRVDAVLRRATAQLPQPRRAVVQLRRLLYKVSNLPRLLRYYFHHPAMLTKRLKHLFGFGRARGAASFAEEGKAIAGD